MKFYVGISSLLPNLEAHFCVNYVVTFTEVYSIPQCPKQEPPTKHSLKG